MKIKLDGHGPLQVNEVAEETVVPWEDIWVSYEPPGDPNPNYSDEVKNARWAPCLIGRWDLRRDQEMTKHVIADNPTDLHLVALERVTLATLEAIDRELEGVPDLVWDGDVYCREDGITRTVAERAIARMLEERLPLAELDRVRPYEFEWVPVDADNVINPA